MSHGTLKSTESREKMSKSLLKLIFPTDKRKMISGREAGESKNGWLYFLTIKFQLVF